MKASLPENKLCMSSVFHQLKYCHISDTKSCWDMDHFLNQSAIPSFLYKSVMIPIYPEQKCAGMRSRWLSINSLAYSMLLFLALVSRNPFL